MSDEQLRELERRYKESGDPSDGAAWLRARLHAGQVTENQLRLRAYDGDEAARQALGEWKDDTAWFFALKEKRDAENAERLAKAKAEAAAKGKEPFDMEALARVYGFSDPFEAKNYRKYAGEYEYRYYVHKPEILSIDEFARWCEEMDAWD